MNPIDIAEQLRNMRRRAILVYRTTPAGPVYGINGTTADLGVLTDAADLLERQQSCLQQMAGLFGVPGAGPAELVALVRRAIADRDDAQAGESVAQLAAEQRGTAPAGEPVAWADADAICNAPDVDEAFRTLLDDQTGDNAVEVVRAILRYAQPAAAYPADRMSSVAKHKAAHLMASGYEVAGYVLVRDGDRSAVLWDAAVRWITPAERHRLMHVEDSLIDQPAAARVPQDQRAAFEAWVKVDSTLPVDRDCFDYKDFTVALLWHAWQAAQKANAPGGALVGDDDANGRPGLAGADSTCRHEFALQPSSGIKLCTHCGLSEVAARKTAAARVPLTAEQVRIGWAACSLHPTVDPRFLEGVRFAERAHEIGMEGGAA